MKIRLRIHLLTTLFLFSFLSLHSATITWLGGNAAWDNASQWDTGTVPTSGDDVIIPFGYVKIYNGDYESATSVEVQSSARLYIYEGGHLEISGAVDNDGLHNMGRVYVWGDLAINSITQTSPVFSANAIQNDSRIYTYSNSFINIKYIDDVAIENDPGYSYFRARGIMSIRSIGTLAIFNSDRFYNSGTITVSNSGISSGFLVANTDDFRNLTGGEINLSSDIYGGFSNATPGAHFRNYGDLNIEDVHIAINNHDNFTNYSSGNIAITYANSTGILNRSGATFTNDGNIATTNSGCGLTNYGDLTNNKSFTVFNANNNGAIINHTSGVIDNYAYIYLNGDGSRDIWNHGEIYSYHGAHMAVNKKIDISSGGIILNYGFFVSYGSSPHVISGTFYNKGVIDDDHGHLQGAIDNLRVVVAPITGPLQVGVPYPNALDVASLIDVDIQNWLVSPTGAIAGTYNETTNEFTPNASAVGLSTIYVQIYDVPSGVGRNFSLELGSPVVPLTSRKLSSTRNNNKDSFSSTTENEVMVFPNPTSGKISLECRNFESLQSEILIYNNLGQLVQTEHFGIGNRKQSIDFDSYLTNGMYIVKIIQDDQELDTKRIQLFR